MVQRKRQKDEGVSVVGVYKVRPTKALFRKAWKMKFADFYDSTDSGAVDALRAELADIVLIELIMRRSTEEDWSSSFHQPGSDQTAYDETYLSLDGTRVLARSGDLPPKSSMHRVAFFLHFYDSKKPLLTPWGRIALPPALLMPRRLRRLVPYEPVD